MTDLSPDAGISEDGRMKSMGQGVGGSLDRCGKASYTEATIARSTYSLVLYIASYI